MMRLADFTRSVGNYRGVRIYESSVMGEAYHSAGIALPGYGIIVAPGVYSKDCDIDTVRHEYGHFIQARMIGYVAFYFCIGIPSLLSAWTRGYGRGHQQYWTEKWCNYLVGLYDQELPQRRYPAKDLSKKTKWFLGCA